MTRSPAARSARPVSVRSTTASAISGIFASVAPYESVISACTPCFSRKRRVSSGYSVWTRTPSGRSFTDCHWLSPATASTMRVGRAVAFE